MSKHERPYRPDDPLAFVQFFDEQGRPSRVAPMRALQEELDKWVEEQAAKGGKLIGEKKDG